MERIRKFRDGEFFTVEKLSDNIEKTPEGYLVCHNVPISRTGDFLYGAEESGVSSMGGVSVVHRSPAELFSERTIKSFEGKPVTIGHAGFVRPDNWRRYAVGIVTNVRRGEGADSDKLLADLLVTDTRGIRAVEEGRYREVSCGYNATAVDDGSGSGHQEGIVGNHVAFVEKGRCGDACAIRDEEMKKLNPKTMLRRLFKDGDEERFAEALDGMDVRTAEDADPAAEQPAEQAAAEEKPDLETRIAGLEKAVGEIAEAVKALQEPKKETEDEAEEPAAEAPAEEPSEAPVEEAAPEETVGAEEAREVIADAEACNPETKRPGEKEIADGLPRSLVSKIARDALAASAGKAFADGLDDKALAPALKAAASVARRSNNPRAVGYKDRASTRTNADLNQAFKAFWRK